MEGVEILESPATNDSYYKDTMELYATPDAPAIYEVPNAPANYEIPHSPADYEVVRTPYDLFFPLHIYHYYLLTPLAPATDGQWRVGHIRPHKGKQDRTTDIYAHNNCLLLVGPKDTVPGDRCYLFLCRPETSRCQ